MDERTCFYCAGTGIYASPMTNWDGVRCDRCNGTGQASPIYRAGEATARRMIAELDAYVDGVTDSFPGMIAGAN